MDCSLPVPLLVRILLKSNSIISNKALNYMEFKIGVMQYLYLQVHSMLVIIFMQKGYFVMGESIAA